MQNIDLSLLDAFPEAVLRLEDGTIAYLNEAARGLLPELSPGDPLPASLELLACAGQAAGVFTEQDRPFSFSASRSGQARLIVFRPASPPVLTARELEGSVRSFRELLSDFSAEMGPLTASGAEAPAPGVQADFTKSFHRMVRLVNNLDYFRSAATPEGVPFRPVTMDLAGLCRSLTQDAGNLLRGAGVALWYDAQVTALLIPGDPALLRRMLLGLISNAAQAAKGGNVTLSLRLRGERAVLTLSDSGGPLDRRATDALLHRGSGEELPLPGQRAGLGLTIARHIAVLHRGALLVDLGKTDGPTVLISLPTGPLDPGVTVRSPAVGEDGGFDPLLVELSDVLPAEPYGLAGLE